MSIFINGSNTDAFLKQGTYTGDGTQNRGISHTIGISPKAVMISFQSQGAWICLMPSQSGWGIGHAGGIATETIQNTAGDLTNFYVGYNASGSWGNEDLENLMFVGIFDNVIDSNRRIKYINGISSEYVVVKGNYNGNGNVNRSVAHGLGYSPLITFLTNQTDAPISSLMFQFSSQSGWFSANYTDANYSFQNTVGDLTNFYVGQPATAGLRGNDNNDVHNWIAI